MRLIGCKLKMAVAAAALVASPAMASGITSVPVAHHHFKNFPVRPKAPKGAPNVLLVMTDDVGFAATSTFGGVIPMPAYDALAVHGLRYNNFRTTAMCSPTFTSATRTPCIAIDPSATKAAASNSTAQETADAPRERLCLFNDTFNTYSTPEVAIAATEVFEAAGFEVLLPGHRCCG